jgi:hypothetical protein
VDLNSRLRHFSKLAFNSEILGLGRGVPKSGPRYDKFDCYLRLTQKGWAETDDSAEQFLSTACVLNVNNLLRPYSGTKKYQRSVVAHNHGVCLF